MSAVRLRRLQADFEQLKEFVRRQPRVRLIQAEGNPPERYQLEYQVAGLRQVDEQLEVVRSHMVEIALPLGYPRMPPVCRMLTPVFHPNIAPHAICIGDHWSAGEPLWSMVARIGEMLAYQSYNTKSPLNGEAARWVQEHPNRLPLDRISLSMNEPLEPAPGDCPDFRVATRSVGPKMGLSPFVDTSPQAADAKPPAAMEARSASEGAPAAAVAPGPTLIARPVSFAVTCPGCGTAYRVPAAAAGKRLRCKHCEEVIAIPSP